MGEHHYLVVATSRATPEQVFDLLADAPRWREWAGSSIRESGWVSPTTDAVGAVRKLGRKPICTLETITEYERPPHQEEGHRSRACRAVVPRFLGLPALSRRGYPPVQPTRL
jgi:Polyketide cyclase / dehydrase and lipid transport